MNEEKYDTMLDDDNAFGPQLCGLRSFYWLNYILG